MRIHRVVGVSIVVGFMAFLLSPASAQTGPIGKVPSLQKPEGGIPDIGKIIKLELDLGTAELKFASFEFVFKDYEDMVVYLVHIGMDSERVGKFVNDQLNAGIKNPNRVLIELNFRGTGDDGKPVILDEPVLRIPAVGFDSSKVGKKDDPTF